MNYIDICLGLLLITLCFVLYSPSYIINLLRINNTTVETNPVKPNNNPIKPNINPIKPNINPVEPEIIPIESEINPEIIPVKPNINPEVIPVKPEIIPANEDNYIRDIYQVQPYDEYYVAKKEDVNKDTLQEYLKTYKPYIAELESKRIRGYNYSTLDNLNKTHNIGNLPLKNNEYKRALGYGFVFKDSAAL